MRLFVDASALVAVVENEPGRDELVDRLGASTVKLWSPLSFWESVSALRSTYNRQVSVARARVAGFGDAFGLELVTVGGDDLGLALDAYETYGKGTGHRAQLNFGDCFAYACAKTNCASLLYKGDDFTHTDLA